MTMTMSRRTEATPWHHPTGLPHPLAFRNRTFDTKGDF